MGQVWSTKFVRYLIVPPVLAVAASCTLVTDTCACTRVAPFVAVEGTIQDSLGAALEGISVSLSLGDASCGGMTVAAQVVSDTAGAYLVAAGGPSEGTAGCAALEALRFLDTSIDTVRQEALAVTFGFEEPVVVDLVFPPR